MRTLIYYVATSLDGYIAAQDGSFDRFPAEGPHIADLIAHYPETLPTAAREAMGVDPPNRWIDTVLMGRHTYDVAFRAGIASPYRHLRQIVFSRSIAASPDPGVELIAGDPLSFVRALKRESGRSVWLCGGGDLASQIYPEIDELILKINPILFGSGIPLFSRPVSKQSLQLVASTTYPNGFILCRYLKKCEEA